LTPVGGWRAIPEQLSLGSSFMRVRYRPAWSHTFLVLGGLTLTVTVINFVASGRLLVPSLVPGLISLVVGFAYRSRPYFELAADHLRAPAPLGPLAKTYDFADLSQLSVRDRRVWVGGKKTGLSQTMAHPGDWQGFEQHVQAAETFE